ncbi:hypothetical protein NPIL_404531 [Nephila pilipes]|uniref:Uncharacterized protein n=1 Tax=Nephila pilipes TaxID=299642 RepID=A0A8X6UVK5_NEPPI|nr:hypothetical protein NPIL_404531 [Nephila pilipes]
MPKFFQLDKKKNYFKLEDFNVIKCKSRSDHQAHKDKEFRYHVEEYAEINSLEIKLSRHQLLRINNRISYENPKYHQSIAFQKIPPNHHLLPANLPGNLFAFLA